MNKFYAPLHKANRNIKKQFLRIGVWLAVTLFMVLHADAQCVPAPVVDPVSNQVLCNNTSATSINFTGTATSYNWINNTPSIGLAASGTGNIVSFTALNPAAVPVNATVTVTPVTGACSGTPINFTLTVNPSPVVVVTPNAICGGPCNSMTAGGSGADIYAWSPITGLYTNCPPTQPYVGNNFSTVYTAPTNYNLYMVTGINSSTGCMRSAMAMPNYTPPAPVVIPPSVFMCLGDPPVKLKVISATGSAQFCSGPVNIAVPDNNPAGASNSIAVSGIPGCIITGMTVTINMLHTRIGNMVFVLRGPNGQIINLDYHLTATGGNGPTTGFVNSIISSIGTVSLNAGTNPYTGTFRADALNAPGGGFGSPGPIGMQPTASTWSNLLSVPNGNWTLGFYDGVTGDVGTLTSWCLGITYSCASGTPTTPAIWSPAAGLYFDPAATGPYIAGTAIDSVWARPIPSGIYPYQVTTQGLPPALCTPTTNFVSTNGNATITFNVKNNHPFPIILSQIDSRTLTANATYVTAYYKTTGINGPPGLISPANGWNQFGGAFITGTGTGVQPFISNLQLVIPAGTTYGICVQAVTTANLPNLFYSSLSPGNFSFNDGGCELITGTNIGYSGTNIPAVPTTTPSGFIGAVHFSQVTATCTSPPATVVVTVGMPTTITVQPVNKTICTNAEATFTVATAGTATNSYQWQVSRNTGSTYTNIADAGVYSGATTATLTVINPPVSMSGYYYRVVINGTATCGAVTSGIAILTVNPLTVILIWAHPYTKLLPGLTTTLSSQVSPNAAAAYSWFHNGSVIPGPTADTLLVDFSGIGLYQLKVTDINGCTNVSDTINIRDSAHGRLFVYPNPNTGHFQVRYYTEANTVLPGTLMVYDNMGNRVLTKSYTQTSAYEKIDVDIRRHGKGLYWIELNDKNGKRLNLSGVLIQ